MQQTQYQLAASVFSTGVYSCCDSTTSADKEAYFSNHSGTRGLVFCSHQTREDLEIEAAQIVTGYLCDIHSSPPGSDKEKEPGKAGSFSFVRHIDLSWNTLEPSLVLMYQKLVDLDWTHYNGEVYIIEPETEESRRHAN
jgi:hypothetical protein